MSFHPAVDAWFGEAFGAPTLPQQRGWPVIARGESALIVAPTGSGKTLAAFLASLDRVMFTPAPARGERCRVLYVSPLKALAVDVERNLRAPVAGIARVAEARGDPFRLPAIAIRTGDTPAGERARFQRDPADLLITTPESLYLLLTSRAREALRSVETVIVDEIHALVPTKRGAHLALSLERLEALAGRPLQRLGLSATQQPLDEVARFLGGADVPARVPSRQRRTTAATLRTDPAGSLDALQREFSDEIPPPSWRPVTIVDARQRKALELRVDVPVEDMAKLSRPTAVPGGPAAQGPSTPSIWSSIHPRLLELIRAHQSTLLFVNSRRLAERLAAALNELADEPLVRSHHGSLARPQRVEVEDALKSGRLRALVATSSLELGIDMGAVDLVVQIEAPPSIASGLQRIGRAGHHVGAVSNGVIVPKFRGDLVACAAVTAAMHDGHVEATRYPRNPLDVLAQHVVSMLAVEPWQLDDLLARIRGAAPYTALSRRAFEGVIDMLSGRYPSDDFAELRPRVTWDRVTGELTAREGSLRVAVANAGTIPDRGLYGVFLKGAAAGKGRVGELDEEMVFESRVGETFTLGASTWRIEDITHDRVLVSPAPGEPGKMPFWKGDPAGRPQELGLAIGRLVRELRDLPPAAAVERLTSRHDLNRVAAENLLQYLADQQAAAGAVPDDRTIVVERSRDELGDWRLCLLSPLGGRVLIPWCLAATARLRDERGLDVETMWSDDGFVVRVPDVEEPPDASLLVPDPEEVEALVIRQLGDSALFAAKFREVAGRALLLPRRRAGARAPLWQQRKRAADLLAVASRFGSFPAVLETYRECLRDVFDMPALVETLTRLRRRSIRLHRVDTAAPSPFAASLLFSYVATFLYDGDAPLAERRAQALSVDHAQLRELLGDAELRELLDADVLASLERQLQGLDERYRARSRDGLHDLLLRIGDLADAEVAGRAEPAAREGLAALLRSRRALRVPVAGEPRFIAVEDAARYRDGLGVPLPPGLPEALLDPVAEPLGDLLLRYARTHGPFTTAECARRFGLAAARVEPVLVRFAASGRLVQGEFRPGGVEREWCGSDVLRTIRQRSLARLRREVEPVDESALGRFTAAWHGVASRRAGLDALLDAVEQLQGAAVPASELESEILPARIDSYDPADLDRLIAAGEVIWAGVEPLGDRDGRVTLFLTDHLGRLWPPGDRPVPEDPVARRIVSHLEALGASFFPAIHQAAGGGYPGDVVRALWDLVWRGLVTNDSLQPLRAFVAPPHRHRKRPAPRFRSRRQTPADAQGRWSLVGRRLTGRPSPTEWGAALARQLLARHGVLTREAMNVETVPGGFSAVYDVLRAMEDSGRLRRGLFVAGLGAAQFAQPAALDLLRSVRAEGETQLVVTLAATDPANPYGGVLRWPAVEGEGRGPTRSAGTTVVLVDGRLAAWLGRRDRQLLAWLPEDEPVRTRMARGISAALARLSADPQRQGLLVAEINGTAASDHPLGRYLVEAGFSAGARGMAKGSGK